KEPDRPFEYVEEQESWLINIAKDLDKLQQRAVQEQAGNLSIVIRYASEMNDARSLGKNEWGRDPAGFIKSFRFVREIFNEHADRVRFSFSPTVRADIDLKALPGYWPGKPTDPFPYVNVIACTWYVGEQNDFAKATEKMRSYFINRKGRNLPFGFDELGGRDGTGGNDRMMLQMLGEIDKLGHEVHGKDIHFEYATLFIDGSDFGRDATLAFLKGHQDSFA
ncbi:MAG: hypothetical protein M3347_03740, partial [Armatimonadota bacterium]|nr:hypothetical protein [Armatimonadota bacterium]